LRLTIEKLIYGGDGLAHLPADERGRGKAAFIPFVLGEEEIQVTITENKSGFARGHATEVVTPSPHRVQPSCPYFGSCGGCRYQHADYKYQLDIKKEILRESLRRIAKAEIPGEIQVHASAPWNYRNRSRLQLQTKPEFGVGYFKSASCELLPVQQCPISSPLINRGIEAVWRMGSAGKDAEGIHETEFFANADDSRMLAELTCDTSARRSSVQAWAEELRATLPEITGVAAFRESRKGVREELASVGKTHLLYSNADRAHRVSAGAFFQTNRFLVDELVQIVAGDEAGELALDLYAGVGLFSTALACNFHHIVSVESSQTAAGDLQYNLPANGRATQATAEQFLRRIEGAGRAAHDSVDSQSGLRPDLIVVDPPRSGLGDRVARLLTNVSAPRITYVSCDPATLARDLVILLGAGYRIKRVHMADMFPQTYHLESVVKLVR
jgi:23S rRNA (uracil1939-C5)-methyltransferase